MESMNLREIGVVRAQEGRFWLEVRPEYQKALIGLEGFQYLNLLWWFHKCDSEECRSKLVEESPYQNGPEMLGTFATRSPERPNPLGLSCAEVTSFDMKAGVLEFSYLDAEDGTPVLDIKPYTPSVDRVESPGVPVWSKDWPINVETSGDFDWSLVFQF